jgi:cation transport ATPase
MKRLNQLDEMQEQELLKIEHNGCWLAFWMLLAAVIVQSIFFNADLRMLAGEWIIFMVLAFYLAGACIRKGIWDRTFEMNTKTNLVVSLIAGLALGIIWAVKIYKDYQMTTVSAATGIIVFAVTFTLCFIALSAAMKATAKRQAKMEEEPSDADEV